MPENIESIMAISLGDVEIRLTDLYPRGRMIFRGVLFLFCAGCFAAVNILVEPPDYYDKDYLHVFIPVEIVILLLGFSRDILILIRMARLGPRLHSYRLDATAEQIVFDAGDGVTRRFAREAIDKIVAGRIGRLRGIFILPPGQESRPDTSGVTPPSAYRPRAIDLGEVCFLPVPFSSPQGLNLAAEKVANRIRRRFERCRFG